MSIFFCGIAIESEELPAFVWFFTRPVEQDEVDHTRDGVRTVNGASAIFQNFRAGKSTDRNRVDVREFKSAAAIDKGEGICLADAAQIDERLAVTAVRIIFRGCVSDEGRQLTQTFDRGIRTLLLQDFRGVNGDRQSRFRFRRRNVRTSHDDSLGGGFCRWRRCLRVGARGDEERKSDADCESRAEGS